MSGGGMEGDKVQSQIVTVQCPLWDGMGSTGHDTTTSADPQFPSEPGPPQRANIVAEHL